MDILLNALSTHFLIILFILNFLFILLRIGQFLPAVCGARSQPRHYNTSIIFLNYGIYDCRFLKFTVSQSFHYTVCISTRFIYAAYVKIT